MSIFEEVVKTVRKKAVDELAGACAGSAHACLTLLKASRLLEKKEEWERPLRVGEIVTNLKLICRSASPVERKEAELFVLDIHSSRKYGINEWQYLSLSALDSLMDALLAAVRILEQR